LGYSRKNPHTPPTDGILEILVGGGSKTLKSRQEGVFCLGNPHRRAIMGFRKFG